MENRVAYPVVVRVVDDYSNVKFSRSILFGMQQKKHHTIFFFSRKKPVRFSCDCGRNCFITTKNRKIYHLQLDCLCVDEAPY